MTKRHGLTLNFTDFSSLSEKYSTHSEISDYIWSHDYVVTLGGDGHFLKAANYVKSNQIPLIGINTDPERSFGRFWSHKMHNSLVRVWYQSRFDLRFE